MALLKRFLFIFASILLLQILLFSTLSCTRYADDEVRHFADSINAQEAEAQVEEGAESETNEEAEPSSDASSEPSETSGATPSTATTDLPQVSDQMRSCKRDRQCRTVTIGCCVGGEIDAIAKQHEREFKHSVSSKCRKQKRALRKENKRQCPKGSHKLKYKRMKIKTQCVEGMCQVVN